MLLILLLLFGGFIVLFNVFLSIIQNLKIFQIIIYLFSPILQPLGIDKSFIIPVLSGLIELTSGVNLVSIIPSVNLGINVTICAFLIGFGGISILLQVWSIISKSDISIKSYIYGKLLQGTLASIYTFLIICNVNYFKYLLF